MPIKWRLSRLRQLLVVSVTSTLLMLSLRMVIVNLILPAPWADTDNVHLYHVIKDVQRFDVDGQPKRRAATWSNVQVNISSFGNFLQRTHVSNSTFYSFLKSLPRDDKQTQDRLTIMSKFQPSMTPMETAQLLFAFDTFSRACAEAGLVYFVIEASLMGVVRHHGLIPWDDDIDVAMSAGQWRDIREVLDNIAGFQLFAPSESQWKFYMESAAEFPNKPFRFPSVDIFFYAEDESHIWALTRGLKHDLVFAKSDIFPLQLRPFEHMMVPVPCNLGLLVHKYHNRDECVTPEYNHKTNENFYFRGTTAVSCHVLYDLYPFVFTRRSRRAGFEDEFLKVGSKVLHRKTFPVGCKTQPLSAS